MKEKKMVDFVSLKRMRGLIYQLSTMEENGPNIILRELSICLTLLYSYIFEKMG